MKKIGCNGGIPMVLAVFAALLLFTGEIYAKAINAKTASRAVENLLGENSSPMGAMLGNTVKKTETFFDEDGLPVYHVVYLEPEGFVIVSGDDAAEPFIAFVEIGNYDPSSDNPLGALADCEIHSRIAFLRGKQAHKLDDKQIQKVEQQKQKNRTKWHQYLKSSPDESEGKSSSSGGGAAITSMEGLSQISDVRVDVLVQSEWSQGSISGKACYNYYTPPNAANNPANYPCGCTATATAQVMRYHQFPTAGIGVHQFSIKIDGSPATRSTRGGDGAGGPYHWSDMVLVPDSSITDAQREAIGALCYDVGIAMHMEYSASGSAAALSYASEAMKNTFGYGNADTYAFGQMGGCLEPDTLCPILNPNLDAGLPNILAIKGTYIGQTVYHAIVCDGYGYDSGTMYHHLNMGWAGVCDAWYNIPNMGTDIVDFYCVYGFIANIFTTGTGEIISGRVTDVLGNPVSGVTVTAQKLGDDPVSAQTNNRGIYALVNVDDQTKYSVTASKSPYYFVSKNIKTGGYYVGNQWGIDFTAYPYPVYNANTGVRYDTIQAAINAAVSGQEIVVCPGTYNEHLSLNNKNITIRSLFPEDPQTVENTIINGGGTTQYVVSFSQDHSTLKGFTVTNSGAFACIYSYNSTPIIKHCVIRDNSNYGIYASSGSLTVDQCMIKENGGRGIYLSFVNNTASIKNSMIVNNNITALAMDNSYANLYNCTISNNTNPYGEAAGLQVYYNSYLDVKNCILWGNQNYEIRNYYSYVYASYSDVEGGINGSKVYGTVSNGGENIGQDVVNHNPRFNDPFNPTLPDYNLQWGSPCWNAGASGTYTGQVDWEGQPRVGYGTIDIGADEIHPISNGQNVYNTLTEAIDNAADGDKILIAPGTYAENIYINDKEITLRGMYKPSSDKLCVIRATIFNKSVSGSIFNLSGGSVTLEGFTIADGDGGTGPGAVTSMGCNLVIKDCFITDCHGDYVGAMTISEGTLMMENTVIEGSTAGGPFQPSTIQIYQAGGAIRNSTIVSEYAGACCLEAKGNVEMDFYNMIIWNPQCPAGVKKTASDTLTYTNCDISGCGGSSNWNSAIGINNGGNIDVNPAFVNSAAEDFRLLSTSPCIDAGTSGLSEDIEGNARPFDVPGIDNNGGLPDYDIGAFEFVCPARNINTGTWYNTIQAAINAASSGNEIEVRRGVHSEHLTLNNKYITLRSINPADNDIVEKTVIDGGGTSQNIVSFQQGASTFKGFTVKNGGAAACIYSYNGTPTIKHCIIRDNISYGIFASGGSITVDQCQIKKNNGRGIYLSSVSSTANIKNSMIVNNNITGLCMSYSNANLYNCTISNNTNPYGESAGLQIYYNSNIDVKNCILWGDQNYEIRNYSSYVYVSYSDVEGGVPGPKISGSVSNGGGNINSNPLFVDPSNPTNPDYHLQTGSPCYNTGQTGSYPNQLDIDGEPRVGAGRVDMGADELY